MQPTYARSELSMHWRNQAHARIIHGLFLDKIPRIEATQLGDLHTELAYLYSYMCRQVGMYHMSITWMI